MSIMRPLLNLYLRLTERPHLARVSNPDKLRRSFERKARMFFHAPRGTRKRETILGGRPALEIQPKNTPTPDAPLVFYLHGGGYIFGSPRGYAATVARLCKEAGARGVALDYRKAPENPHPAAIEDALAAYLALLEQGENPARIIVGGDSAGGGLTLALIAQLCAQGHPLPAGAFAFSPLTDLTYSGASITQNAASDVVLPATRVLDMTQIFVGDGAREDPRASPLYADFSGAPPIWLTASDSEILLDDTVRMSERLKTAGVDTTVTIRHGLPHVWPIFFNVLPEGRETLRDVAAWIKQRVA